MKVNRLSLGLQDQLKEASNFNTARRETLFDKEKFGIPIDSQEEVNFANLDVADLNISEDQIGNLLKSFETEVINVFSNNLPDLFGDNPLKQQDKQNPEQKPVFTA